MGPMKVLYPPTPLKVIQGGSISIAPLILMLKLGGDRLATHSGYFNPGTPAVPEE